jgi:hypothetical protein
MAEKQSATRRGRPVLALRFVGRRQRRHGAVSAANVGAGAVAGARSRSTVLRTLRVTSAFGVTKPHSSRLAQGQNRLGRGDSPIVSRT